MANSGMRMSVGQRQRATRHMVSTMRSSARWRRLEKEEMANGYLGIDFCDRCGGPLDDGRWLSGICSECEEAGKDRPVEALTPRKGL